MNLGKRIESRLKELGLKRKDLLERVEGLTDQALSALITRDSKRSEWDERIAAALGMHVMELVYGKRPFDYETGQTRRLVAQEPTMPEPLGRLLAIASTMSHDGQLVLLGRAHELALQYPAAKANHAA